MMLTMPDVYMVEVQSGRMDPVPWYYEYFVAADRLNCKPWELIPEPTPVEYWKEAALIVVQAESDKAKFDQQHNTSGNK